jgi:hypothetical protein
MDSSIRQDGICGSRLFLPAEVIFLQDLGIVEKKDYEIDYRTGQTLCYDFIYIVLTSAL